MSKNIELMKDSLGKEIQSSPVVSDLLTIRSNISSDDGSNPALGSGQSFIGYKKVELEIIIGGTTPSWDITPLLANNANDTYMEGETITITGSKTHIRLIEINGNSNVNFRVDGKSGTSPTITIKGKGVNS